ncbi:MAG TPA: glycosyltransferase, partial [Verrucomicrobiae bacterium]|nr:glycosyltransferase [Verrucomicrobiae bacterium]
MQTQPNQPTFPGLPGASAASKKPLRVCIASCEFIGPIRNGGIGTAYTAMAHALVAAGHDVTLFYTQGEHCENETVAHWKSFYQKQGLRFIARSSDPNLHIDAPDHPTRSYETYRWLKTQNFDLVHFPEWGGDAYYSVLAKHQGIAFERTQFCIGTHSPNAWLKQANSEHLAHPADIEVDYMERRAIALADIVVSPCQYMLRWMLENGFELPSRSYVQQNILPASARGNNAPISDTRHPVTELVFFGRLETRKGIELFCDALDRLAKDPTTNRNVQVTFMGKPATINGFESRAYLQSRAKNWPWKLNVLTTMDQPSAMRYLREPGRLAVIPSLMENSPYTVLECLGSRIPFLASRVGGIPELIADADIEHSTFLPVTAELAGLLSRTLQAGIRPWRPAAEATATEKSWVDWHNAIHAESAKAMTTAPAANSELPLVTVCIAHYNRPKFLKQSLASLEAQDYPKFEVIIVDDGSTQPEAVQYLAEIEPKLNQRGWRIVRQKNLYLSAARNTGARNARGEYVMFMDDDNYARPEEISTFVKVARHTGADILTCCMEYFEGTDAPRPTGKPVTRWVPLGPDVASGYFRNCFGDANCLVKRSTFEKLGGFTEIHGVTHEDWEFLANAALKGCHLEVIPESLFHYRYTPDSMIRSTNKYRNHLRHIRPYLNNVPPAMHRILLMAQGAWMAEAAGRNRAWKTTEMSLKWRSQYEAANIVAKLGHGKAAVEQFMTAMKTATATEHPLVILEAMLDIGRDLRKLDAGRARELLRLAIDLGQKSKCSEAVNKAELLLAEMNRTAKPAPSPAVSTQTAPSPVAKNAAAAPKVSIVIPTFNNLALTQACLDSLAKTPCAIPFEIIVVDNASNDGSAQFLGDQEKSGFIRLIANEKNHGFARACNQGAQAARASLVLFLNNDTQVTVGWLEAMAQAAERPKVGIVGAKLLYADNRVQHAGIGFIKGIPDHPHRHAAADAPEVNQFRELDMVTGACLMIHRDLCLKLAGFDEVYRNGVEDIDLCIRARAAGWKVVYEPKATVYHLEGQSVGRFNHVNENLKIFFTRWGKSFDGQTNFIVPNPVKIIPAISSLLLGKTVQAKVDWIGSFLDAGSLSHVNREITNALAGSVTLNRVNTGAETSASFKNLATEVSKAPATDAAVTVRHAWPPNWSRPKSGKFVVVQPWEFGSLPEQWVKDLASVDEAWVPSEYVRNVYVDSGVPANKVFVVPNGVDTTKFHPQVAPMKLTTDKKFKFLFVGGTILRKGPDVLLKAYLEAFTAADDVCLVIKDFGGKTVYAGQTFEEKIRAAQTTPNAPEILYLNNELAPEELPGLYRACDCLVLPYRGEGYGLPVVEAMACGLPVMVTAGGATDD